MYKRIRKHLNGLVNPAGQPRSNCSGFDHVPEFEPHRHIRLLTFNIQVGINTSSYRHYLTRSWQHVLPHRNRIQNLDRIAHLIGNYDVVALQEEMGAAQKSQPMAVRLCKMAEEGPVWTEYEKPEKGGRAVARGTSGQKLWKNLRKAAFRGYCSYDVAGSHLALANALTGGQFGAISGLVGEYEPSLRKLADAIGLEGSAGRKAAKEFFLSILNGGGVQGWKEKHGVG
ncbi:endonuclease/exonuclease/phosphatase family protein, partial [Marinobacter sp.]|uniref:endonuclease/exonuclease/phosphatase family protein n=1 Tax=Marinobacter sp. TaxID=50741 RepID=UPI0035C77050